MSEENQTALDEAYENGFQDGSEVKELEMQGQIDEAVKEAKEETREATIDEVINAIERIK